MADNESMVALALAAIAFNLPDTEGARHTSAHIAAGHAAVFVFLSPACPLSSRYAPELIKLHAAYRARNVLFYGVLAEPTAAPEQARAWASERGFTFPVLLDPSLTLARQLGARVTPEAALVGPDKRIAYVGRIDDRAVSIGQLRRAVTRYDLRIALDRYLDGKRATPPAPAIGCAIPFAAHRQNLSVTFSKQIAPILFRHCASCHRPGQTAPFPLLAYEDAAPRARTIAAVTASRTMPPWKAAPQRHRFLDERRLTAAEIELLRRWAANGAPEGDRALTPPAPEFTQEPPQGAPDLTVAMPGEFEIPASGEDIYRCFVIPTALGQSRWVRAIDFVPGSGGVVHHALVFADTSGAARKRAAADPSGDSYSCFGIPGFLPAASYGGWSPGMTSQAYPEGVAFRLPRGADIVLQVHYHPSGKLERDRSSVRFYFRATPPERRLMDVALGSRDIDIPAGEARYRIADRFTLPVDVTLTGVIPHAHYICRRMRGWAVLPDGRRLDLITIPEWDFDWQHQYRYVEPIRLPAGTRLEMEFVYDNSAANPRNPNAPPQRVTWGPGSTDEMAGLHFQVIPGNDDDARELGQWLWGKIMRELGGGIFRPPDPN